MTNWAQKYDEMYANNTDGFRDYVDNNKAVSNNGTIDSIHNTTTGDYNPTLLDKFYIAMGEVKDSQDSFIKNYATPLFNNAKLIICAVACGVIYYKFFYKGAKK